MVNGLTTIFLLALALCVNLVLYPHELALQAIGRGSDSSDALIRGGKLLLMGHFPYSTRTYLHNLISPGPGWILMAMPFSCSGLSVLLTPFSTTFSALMIKQITKSNICTNLFLVFMFSSLVFWQTSVQGSDYVAIGMVFGIIVIYVFNYLDLHWGNRAFLILLTGLSATARISFLYLGLLMGFFLWQKNKVKGVVFGISSFLLTMLFHAVFYLWDPTHYSPLHVLFDKPILVPNYFLISILCCSIVAIITFFKINVKLENWLFFLWLCLVTPLLVLDIGKIIHKHWMISGSGMFSTIAMPIIAMWACFSWRNYAEKYSYENLATTTETITAKSIILV